jgi:hypothetical protein
MLLIVVPPGVPKDVLVQNFASCSTILVAHKGCEEARVLDLLSLKARPYLGDSNPGSASKFDLKLTRKKINIKLWNLPVGARQFQDIWLEIAVDRRKLTKNSTPNDNTMMMYYDFYYPIIETTLKYDVRN